jgi:flavin-dependent dehydrogenase
VVEDVVEVTGSPAFSIRRITLDEILVGVAAEAGAEVRTGTPVTGLVVEEGRVAGVTTPSGKLRARLVVGADGARSTIAKLVGAKEYHRTTNGRVFMWAYFSADPSNGEMWIGKVGDHAYLVMPTDDDLTLVAACPSIERRAEVRADRTAVYEAGVRAWPELYDGIAGAHREGSIHTMARMDGFFRPSAGPGWALVGDAGHFKDPTPGQGISDALRQSERLAAAIHSGLGGAGNLDAELREWWRWRDEDAWEMYWFAHDSGAAGRTPPVLREAQRRIAADPDLTRSLVRIFNHELRPSEVFTPAFAVGTTARALRRGRGERRAIVLEAGTVARNEVQRHRARGRSALTPSGSRR